MSQPKARKLPPKGSTKETRLGIFKWEGPHLKWCCAVSELGGLNLMIDDYEVTEAALRKLERIFRLSPWNRRLALLRAHMVIKEAGARPEDMQFSGIGVLPNRFPKEVVLDFKYPEAIWPDGELAVSFWFGIPLWIEQGG